jgi:hypothetical protein
MKVIAEDVECPVCEAPVGLHCVAGNGHTRSAHDERRAIAEWDAVRQESGRKDAAYEQKMQAKGLCHKCGGRLHGGACDPRDDEDDR